MVFYCLNTPQFVIHFNVHRFWTIPRLKFLINNINVYRCLLLYVCTHFSWIYTLQWNSYDGVSICVVLAADYELLPKGLSQCIISSSMFNSSCCSTSLLKLGLSLNFSYLWVSSSISL